MSYTNVQLKFSMFYFFVFFGTGALFPLLSVYLDDYIGLTGTQIGVVMSITPIISIVVQPLWGMIADITGKPQVILVTVMLMSAFIGFFYANVTAYGIIFIMAVLLAVFQSAIVPISDSIALSYVQRVKGNYGNIRLWGAIGFATAVLVAGRLSELIGANMIFYAFIITIVISASIAWFLPRERQSVSVNVFKGVSQLIKTPQYVLFLATTFLVFGPIYANNFYFGIFIKDIGGTLTGIGLAFFLAAGSEAPFMKFSKNLIQRFSLEKTLLVAAAISALRWLFYFTEPSLILVYATTVAQGFSVGLFIPAALQFVRDAAPKTVQVTAVTMYTAVGNGLGSWFCTFIGGVILDKYGIMPVYLLFASLTVAGLFVLVSIMMLQKRAEVQVHI
ncbi:MFS transporter [Bacillus sp. HMF5848]|uniref:MFS transporter n=1 Tax=Bacillus sp. HMF5848 TaxID=2495421 RepID=UPI000F77CB3F|nr:MFS transporter [Bacillus sp. HMF5848]RSK28226.1 MFS transporter [Bacillus sp. HMF5848]